VSSASTISKSAVDPRFAAVARAFTRRPDVTEGKLFSAYALKVNGKIFAMFPRGRFVVKLPKSRVDELVESGNGRRFGPGTRIMKEWVSVLSTAALGTRPLGFEGSVRNVYWEGSIGGSSSVGGLRRPIRSRERCIDRVGIVCAAIRMSDDGHRRPRHEPDSGRIDDRAPVQHHAVERAAVLA
jgi:hypothetical protein